MINLSEINVVPKNNAPFMSADKVFPDLVGASPDAVAAYFASISSAIIATVGSIHLFLDDDDDGESIRLTDQSRIHANLNSIFGALLKIAPHKLK